MATTYSLADIARVLNRPAVTISGLQARFELPVFEGSAYSSAYLNFLRNLVYLRTFGISEDQLLRLWLLEKKLLQLLHVDSTGSKTWFLDSCGSTNHPERRLLLSNHDLGAILPTQTVQLGLNFAATMPQLFSGTEMGEDAVRVLKDIVPLRIAIRADVASELPYIREATKWAAQLP